MQLGFTLDDLEKRIRETGYIPRRTDIVGLAGTLLLVDQKAGAKAILLECITKETAKKISSSVSIPTIGIGSSKYCDGQVLVFDDLINIDKSQYIPRFVKNYMNFEKLANQAVKKFCKDVKGKKFPGKKNTYY